jgi:hypothetical protein
MMTKEGYQKVSSKDKLIEGGSLLRVGARTKVPQILSKGALKS